MLALEELLIETDPDLPIVVAIVIGFDDNANLIIEYEKTDYDISENSYKRQVTVNKEEAYNLAKKLNSSLTELPKVIAEEFAIKPFCETVPSQASALFKQIMKYFDNNRTAYKLV